MKLIKSFSTSLLVGLVINTGVLAQAPSAAATIPIAVIEAFSGPLANTGDAVWRNLSFAVDQINAQGGIKIDGVARRLELLQYDSKGQVEDALLALKAVTERGASVVLQGNSSAVAAALIDSIEKNNQRNPKRQVVFLNYAAVDPVLTNEKCSFWHFRFDAHVDMRMNALTEAMKNDPRVKRVYLIGQDYSFGQQVLRSARQMIGSKRQDIQIVGEELHPIGRVKDFAPYIAKIVASGADTVVTGNWGNDLTLLVKAAREAGLALNFYTFYGNSLGAPAALGEAGVGRVRAVSEWHPNAGGVEQEKAYRAFRQQFPAPKDDYFNYRNVLMMSMLARAMQQAGSIEAKPIAKALAGMQHNLGTTVASMRPSDHQLQNALYVQVMESVRSGNIQRDVEGSGFGFKTQLYLTPEQNTLPSTCQMKER